MVEFKQAGSKLTVKADLGDVEQILLNLASNARDALPAGGSVNLALSTLEESGQLFARLEFTDNGVGMDATTLESVFVPFFMTKQLGKGTGLGLSSVYELVTKAKGIVNAESWPGEGTTIEVLLPIVDHEESTSVEGVVETAVPKVDDKAFDNRQIMVVEDETQILKLICELLEQEGFSVRMANNGAEALEMLEKEIPDLMLTDVVMPKMGGAQMVNQLLARGIHIPTIFMSGYTNDRLTAYDFDLNSVALIRKPLSPHFSPGSREQAQDGARLSYPMEKPSLDL